MATQTNAGKAAGQAAALSADRKIRKPNPLKRWPGMPPFMTERRYFVLVNLPLKAGTVVNGQPVPEGTVLKSWQLHVCRSRGQVKKALRRIRQRYPTAYAVQGRTDKDTVSDRIPYSLVLPDSGTTMKGGAA
ncbi:MAG: hypothetical protein AB3X44_07085 [Leptothrix sp. (in: b-proteobacteria)]